jgi:hypothetical protein
MVNGTITVANFQLLRRTTKPAVGLPCTRRCCGCDNDCSAEWLTVKSRETIIAIGRSDIVGGWSESSSARGLHTVASYNPDTKTVTLNEALTQARSGTGVRACLVILLSRQIVISKYGGSNVTLLSGSGRTIQGVLFQSESGATIGNYTTATSSSFNYSAHVHIGNINLFLNMSSINLNNYVGYHASTTSSSIRNPGGTWQVTESVFVNGYVIFSFGQTCTLTLTNIYTQNISIFYNGSGSGTISSILNQVICKNTNFAIIDGTSAYTYIFTISNVTIVDGSFLGNAPSAVTAAIIANNIQMHGYLANDYTACGYIPAGMVIIKNLTGTHNTAGWRIALAGSKADNAVFINCSLSGFGNGLGHDGAADCKYIGCSLANAYNPIIQNHPSGVSEIINLSTNAYYRPTLRIPSVADQLWTNRIIVKGLTVAGTQHPKAFEHLFPHGYVKNRWDAATPDYTTFDFRLTQSSFAGQPIWLEYQVFTADPIRVTGTITQLDIGESVKVQIFSAGKEPLYGDTPDFEQTYTATGDISVNWTPTDARTWVVRVLAYLQQTTNPITITNLQVAGGGAGGGGGQTYNINVTDGITPSLSDAADIIASLMVTDSLNPTLTDQASLSAQIALSDAINPTLQDQSQAQVQVDLSDSINPTLQDIVDVESGTFYNISVADQITPSLADSVDEQIAVSVSESISPQLQDQAPSSIQISASEMISPTLQEQVSEQAQISVNETITPTLQDLPAMQVDVSASETIAPTLQEQVNITAGGTYHIVEPLDIDITEDELEV